MKINALVTGGLGFIGSHLVNKLIEKGSSVTVIDSETYAAIAQKNPKAKYIKCDIRNELDLQYSIANEIDVIFHLAAESHVCRSISGPREFIETNIIGTWNILENLRRRGNRAPRLVYVSTDEVFGDLEETMERAFDENSKILPNSPYAASKASGDLLCRAYFKTYKTDVIITNCSNNFGLGQHEEKLIPRTVAHLRQGRPVVLFGDGMQRRDWIPVEDHVEGLILAAEKGSAGERYLFGSGSSFSNIEVVAEIAKLMNVQPEVILDFNARPTDDRHYRVDYSKAQNELGWSQKIPFLDQLKKIISA